MDTWHGIISRYWTQRPATLGARTQDGFSQAFRCPAAVCWPSLCTVLALYYGYRVVQAQNLAEFWQSSARTSTCTLYSSGRILPETDDPKPTGFLMHWQNSAEFGPNFHLLYRYCADVRYYSTSVYGTSILEYSSGGGILPENRRPEATRMMI